MSATTETETLFRLDQLQKGDQAIISALADPKDNNLAAIRSRLMELGFVHGEKISILAKSIFGSDPIAVRVGDGTFALRNVEASLIYVSLN